MPSNGTTQNGIDDATNEHDAADADDGGMRRRDVLRATAAAGATAVVGIAGCSEVTSRQYEAAPIGLDEGADEMGYSLRDKGTEEVTQSQEAWSLDVEATLVNRFSAYRSSGTEFGLVATPAVKEGGQALNPLAGMSLGEVLSSDHAQQFLARVNVGENGNVEWAQPPEQVGRRDVEFLGHGTEAAAFMGVTGQGEAVLLHLARVEDEGDLVFAAQTDVRPLNGSMDGQSRDGNERATDSPGSGSADDVFGGSTVDDRWERYKNGLGHGHRQLPDEIPTEVCSYCTINGLTITRPEDGGDLIPQEGRDLDHVSVNVSPPAADITAAVEVDGDCSVRLEWQIRATHGGGQNCRSSWTQAGTGLTPTLRLRQCDSGGTTYDIRVQAVDSNGNVLASDQIEYTVQVRAP
jgi:hypothetical protein